MLSDTDDSKRKSALAPARRYTERELLKLSNAELRLLLKKLKITGWLQVSKAGMARQIVFRTEQRSKFQKLSALYNDPGEPSGVNDQKPKI